MAKGRSSVGRVSVRRAANSAFLAAFMLFLLCWLGAQTRLIPFCANYVQLFTTAEPASKKAFLEGLALTGPVGGIVGALVAWCYNPSSFHERR